MDTEHNLSCDTVRPTAEWTFTKNWNRIQETVPIIMSTSIVLSHQHIDNTLPKKYLFEGEGVERQWYFGLVPSQMQGLYS